MKMLFFTDPHVRINKPIYRKDDYYTTILNKLKWVGNKGKELGVDAYLCGGDILDRPDVPYSALTGLTEVLKDYGKPIYSVLGNHDIYGYNPETHFRTALSPLRASGIVTRVGNEPIMIGPGVALTGCDATSTLDHFGSIKEYTDFPYVDGAINIRIVHGFLSKKPWPQVPVTTIDAISKETKAEILLSGHEHGGFGIIEQDGTLFCNPGALGRITASVGDINQIVKVAYIEVDDNMNINMELITLPVDIAKPASEVIDKERMEQDKKHKQEVLSYAQNASEIMSKISVGDGYDIHLLLDRMVEEENIPSDIVAIIKKYIEEAEIECGQNSQEA